MDIREFMRFHLFKALLIFVVIQIAIIAFVQNFNHRPQAIPDKVSMIEGRNVKITPLSNDLDKDLDDKLVLMNVSNPKHGSVKKKENLLYYAPNNGFTGTDSFAYTISDGRKESKNSYITIQINKNLGPVTSHDIAEAYCGGSTIIDVLKNDRDSEGDSIFIKGFSQPAHGRLNVVENIFVYTSNSSTALSDSFHYVINDGKSNSDSVTVIITIKGKKHPCYPWLSCDVGDAAKPGSFSCLKNTFVIEASGSDIWNSADGFRYAYQYVTGDCEMSTKVEKLEALHEWAKAGIMVRESLTGGSKMALIFVSPKNGVVTHQRFEDNNQVEFGISLNDKKAPHWVKITRKGNTFTFNSSDDGTKWQEMSSIDLPMKKDVYIGFAVTSHNNSEVCKAVFSNYRLTGRVVKF